MKSLVVIGALLTCSTVARAQQGVVYVPSAKATPIIQSGGLIFSTPDFSARSNRRTGPGEAEVHDRDTDIMYFLEGEATLVLGGAMVGGTITAPNQQRGTGITGGQTYSVSKGDIIVIPAGLPHWFKEVPRSVIYYTVKVTRP